MRFTDVFSGATDALRANKLRSGLTTLGIIIGVAAVVAMMALTTGMEGSINDQFSGLGANTFQIQKWPAMHFGGGHHITRSDYDVARLVRIITGFRKRHPNIETVYLEPGRSTRLFSRSGPRL